MAQEMSLAFAAQVVGARAALGVKLLTATWGAKQLGYDALGVG